jgi:hypothetical protein
LAEILANHVYTTAGMYAVKTLVYAGGGLVGATVSVVAADEPAKHVEGPRVVPGNSMYKFVFWIPPTKKDDINWDKASITATGDTGVITGDIPMDPFVFAGGPNKGLYGGWDYVVKFANKPGKVTFTLTNWLKNNPDDKLSLEVTVVQVKVEHLPNDFSDPGTVIYKGQIHRDIVVNGNTQPHTKEFVLQSGAAKPPNIAALEWQVQVTLIGPGDGTDGVSHIAVGFHQDLKLTLDRALFGATVLAADMEGNTYLDSDANAVPWQTKSIEGLLKDGKHMPPSYRVGPSGAVPLYSRDSPHVSIPVELNQNGQTMSADNVEALMEFELRVAATTLDGSVLSDGTTSDQQQLLWAEASAEWSIRADGSIDPKGWHPSTDKEHPAGVVAPKDQVWVLTVPKPESLSIAGPTFNDAVQNIKWNTQ